MKNNNVSRLPYKILGVDPGTNILGYAVLEVDGKRLKVITMGEMHLSKFESHQEKLKEIFLQLQEVIETYLPREMAVESPFFGKNVQSMLKLGRAQGVAMAAAMTMGLNITEYSPKKIKKAVTGNGNASKEQVSAMLCRMLKITINSKLLDSSDALAAAVTKYHEISNPLIGMSGAKSWKAFMSKNPSRVKGL